MVTIATGHYARIDVTPPTGKYLLRKALDTSKDQSYVLYNLTQELLARVLLPLGDLTKPQVRELAEADGFVNADKPESQDICFVPDGDYASVIKAYSGRSARNATFAASTQIKTRSFSEATKTSSLLMQKQPASTGSAASFRRRRFRCGVACGTSRKSSGRWCARHANDAVEMVFDEPAARHHPRPGGRPL